MVLIFISFLGFPLPLCVCLCVRDIYADCQIYMLEIPEVNTPFMLIVAGRYGSVPMEKALDGAAIIL